MEGLEFTAGSPAVTARIPRLADFNWFDLTPMAILMAWDIVSSFDIASLGFASHRAYFMSSFSVSLAVGIFTSTM